MSKDQTKQKARGRPLLLATALIAVTLVLRPAAGPHSPAGPRPGAVVTAVAMTPTILTPLLVVRVEGDFLRLDVGPDPLTDVRVTLRAGTRTHTFLIPEGFGTRESTFLALDAFEPPARSGSYSVTVTYRRGGTAGSITIPRLVVPTTST